jgi:hypothetical protein
MNAPPSNVSSSFGVLAQSRMGVCPIAAGGDSYQLGADGEENGAVAEGADDQCGERRSGDPSFNGQPVLCRRPGRAPVGLLHLNTVQC